MSQIAVRIAPSAPSSTARVRDVVDAYVSATFQRFERVLVTQLPTLVEPAIVDPARALRHEGFLVETLVGFAIGSAVGNAITAARRGAPPALRTAIDNLVAVTKRSHLVSVPDTRDAASFFERTGNRLAAAQKPLLDALGTQLQARLCHAAADARRQVHAIEQLVARVAPEHVERFSSAMSLLVDDDASAIGLSDQLAIGWAHLVAAALRQPAPAITNEPRWERTRQLWRTWFQKVTGAPVLAELTQEQVVAAGFVMRIG